VQKNLDRDKGSLYRYKLGKYGSDQARSFLQRIEENLYPERDEG
jgi:hypothetical protein